MNAPAFLSSHHLRINCQQEARSQPCGLTFRVSVKQLTTVTCSGSTGSEQAQHLSLQRRVRDEKPRCIAAEFLGSEITGGLKSDIGKYARTWNMTHRAGINISNADFFHGVATDDSFDNAAPYRNNVVASVDRIHEMLARAETFAAMHKVNKFARSGKHKGLLKSGVTSTDHSLSLRS